MTAFDTFLAYSAQRKFNEYRQSLVGHKKGTLSSGTFADSMSIAVDQENAASNEDGKQPANVEPTKLFQRVGKYQQPGFVFNLDGTEKSVANIASNGKLKLYEDFSKCLKFADTGKRDVWDNAPAAARRRCIGRNVQELIRKTDVNYRTHGDRLHYYVVGLVNITEKKDTKRYPLFLFSCSDIDKNTMHVEVEASGFANFWLDKNYLGDLLMRTLKGYELTIDDTFPAKANDIARKINTLQSVAFDNISCDLSYSSISVVTGFVAEYIDPAWSKILAGQA
ncbi:MAG TPA: hypothetical protein VK978_05320 [Candidatus Saccharimonadales bacterium]|nr:hypothetical protein [Candidatus Saccharimonadales bacterium]